MAARADSAIAGPLHKINEVYISLHSHDREAIAARAEPESSVCEYLWVFTSSPSWPQPYYRLLSCSTIHSRWACSRWIYSRLMLLYRWNPRPSCRHWNRYDRYAHYDRLNRLQSPCHNRSYKNQNP